MDENMSWYLEENKKIYAGNQPHTSEEDFEESNKMHGNHCVLLNF